MKGKKPTKRPVKSVDPDVAPRADPLAPRLHLLVKLGSIAVHAEEFASADGHEFDLAVLRALFADPEVTTWIESMGPLLPRKRK